MRVLTLNVYTGFPLGLPFLPRSARFGRLIDCLKSSNADVVCLQEVFSYDLRAAIGANLETYYTDVTPVVKLPFLNLMARLIALFGIAALLVMCCNMLTAALGFLLFSYSALYLWLTEHPSGLMTLVDRRQACRVHKADHISCGPCGDFQDSFVIRAFLVVHMDDAIIVNTHLDAYGSARMRQVNELIVLGPTIVAGDLNATTDSEEVQWLAMVLKNNAYTGPPEPTWAGASIDHIIAGRISGCQVLPDVGSDHRAVLCDCQ